MKLVLERDQRSGGLMGGKLVFSVAFRAEVSQEERDMIDTLFAAVVLDDGVVISNDKGLVGLGR